MEFFEMFANIPIPALILFGVGIVLLIVEMYVPGFGVAGVSSLIAFALAIIFAADTFLEGLVFTGVVPRRHCDRRGRIFGAAVEREAFVKFHPEGQNSTDEGFSSAADDLRFLVGREGVAQTILRPAGRVSIENKVYDVISSGDFIAPGEKIRVLEVNGNRIVVASAAVASV